MKTPKTKGRFDAFQQCSAGGRCDVVYTPSDFPKNRRTLLLLDMPGLKAEALVEKLNGILKSERCRKA